MKILSCFSSEKRGKMGDTFWRLTKTQRVAKKRVRKREGQYVKGEERI